MVECLLCKQDVSGSSPLTSTCGDCQKSLQEKSATRLKSQTAEINLSQNLENCIVTQISRQTQTFFDG